METHFAPNQHKSFLCGNCHFLLAEKTYLMGIVNVTTDSFSGDGLLKGRSDSETADAAVHLAREMVRAGADILDIGGESSRPGAVSVSEQEELDRVIPIVKVLSRELPVPLSIDTYRAVVAEEALKNGACLINDISGLRGDSRMASVVASYHASVVVMHMQGTPPTMQRAPFYRDVVSEIVDFFKSQLKLALATGINPEQILLDPGIGFGKSVEHNLEILRSLDAFKVLGYPILVGTSRKSFIGKILTDRPLQERLFGTAATVALAIAKGVNFIRVHDVSAMKDVVDVSDAILITPKGQSSTGSARGYLRTREKKHCLT